MLDYLPNEIWYLILDSLSQDDVRNLCLACGRLRDLAQPRLFSNIRYHWIGENSRPLPVARLVRTLAGRRDLAQAVTSISLESTSSHGNYKRYTEIITPDDDDSFEDLAQAAADQMQLSFSSMLAQAIRDAKLDGFVTLLLVLAPNVAKLKLTCDFANKTYLLSKLALDATATSAAAQQQQQKPLGSLAQVEYRPKIVPFGTGGNITNMSEVLPLLYLPSLKNLNAELENAENFDWPSSSSLPAAAPDIANLTHLTLTMVREPYLYKILQQTQSLQYLDWQWVHCNERGGLMEGPVLDLDQICEILSCVRRTLTTLKLRGMAFGVVDSPRVPIKGNVKRLAADMTNITTLEASPLFFMGFCSEQYIVPLHECLPASVHRVCFTDDFSVHDDLQWTSQDEMEVIRTWWQVKSQWTPKLERFEMRLVQTDDQWMLEEREELIELGKAHGISVDVYKKEPDLR